MTPSIAPTRVLVGHETSGAADAAAWCLTGLLFFCIACFVWGAVVLRRRDGQCSSNLAATESENPVESGKPTPEADASAGKAQPWERDGDWWKK